jgi:prevent-host-death family protein
MNTASITEVNADFYAYLKKCGQGPVVITDNNRPVAILMTVTEDKEELERLISAHTPGFTALLDSAKERIRKTGGIEHDEFWKLLDEKHKE